MNLKEVQSLKKAREIVQHKPWWGILFPKLAQKRSEKAKDIWVRCCKSLAMQSKDFNDIWFVLNLCPRDSDTRDACIIIAIRLAMTISDIDMILVKAGLNSKHIKSIRKRQSAILITWFKRYYIFNGFSDKRHRD